MQKRYIFLASLILAMFFIVAMVKERNNCDSSISEQFHFKSKRCTKFTPNKLLLESMSTNRYISVDELATKIIGEDPSYVLIDIRDKKQFDKYTLPGAINVPFQNILDENEKNPYYKSDTYKKVLFSNSTLMSDQAWMIMRRMGCKNMKVLKGGLNDFFLTLMSPPKPTETDASDAFEKYRFRKAAGVYFGMPNPQEFIPELQIAFKEAKRRFTPKTQGNYAPKAKTPPAKKAVKLEKKKVVEEEEEEDEGC